MNKEYLKSRIEHFKDEIERYRKEGELDQAVAFKLETLKSKLESILLELKEPNESDAPKTPSPLQKLTQDYEYFGACAHRYAESVEICNPNVVVDNKLIFSLGAAVGNVGRILGKIRDAKDG